MKKPLLAVGAMFCLSACTSAQLDKAASYQAEVAAACNVAMGLAPMVPTVAPWILGACAAESGIAKLAADPSSLAWLNGLIAKARGA